MDDPVTDPANGGLGIRRGTVRLSEHDPRWASVGATTAAEVADATGIPAGRIEHVGSTSVPGLVAKPILDIAVGVDHSESVDKTAAHLVGAGYLDRGTGGGSVGRLLVRESSPEVRTVHVHVVGFGTEAWRDYVEFRDALRNDPALKDQYAQVKRTLAQRFPEDRTSYRHAKDTFIRSTLDMLSGTP